MFIDSACHGYPLPDASTSRSKNTAAMGLVSLGKQDNARKELTAQSQKRPRMVDDRLAVLLDSAADVFIEQGFDRANFNAICKRAGASKASLYSRYPTKEVLFEAVIHLRLTRVFAKVDLAVLPPDADLEQTLYKFGRNILDHVLSDEMIELTRIISSVAKRFPHLGKQFLELGSVSGIRTLCVFLEAKVDAGQLSSDVPTQVMARQFILIAVDGQLYRKLFETVEPQSETARHEQVSRAVALFKRCYVQT